MSSRITHAPGTHARPLVAYAMDGVSRTWRVQSPTAAPLKAPVPLRTMDGIVVRAHAHQEQVAAPHPTQARSETLRRILDGVVVPRFTHS